MAAPWFREVGHFDRMNYLELLNLLTFEQVGPDPARDDDGVSPLRRFQLGAGGGLQFAEAVWAEVRQRMALQPGPQVLDRIQLRRVRRQECQFDAAGRRVLYGLDLDRRARCGIAGRFADRTTFLYAWDPGQLRGQLTPLVCP